MKLFLTDVDNALLDWSAGFDRFMQKAHPEIVVDTSRYCLGVDPQKMGDYTDQFNQSLDFGSLEPIRDSEIYLPKIHKLGYQIKCISSCLGDQTTYDLRVYNLLKVYGDIFTEISCIPMGSSKKELLSSNKIQGSCFWIEDHLNNAKDGFDLGYKTFVVDHEYNRQRDYAGIKRINTWKQIYQEVLDYETS